MLLALFGELDSVVISYSPESLSKGELLHEKKKNLKRVVRMLTSEVFIAANVTGAQCSCWSEL
jgi:hypothetical protein